jgi:antitoxin ParD1/3/4
MSNEEQKAPKGQSELAALDAAIARGVVDANTGRVKPAKQVFDRLEAKYRALLKS